jgi:hypothetical protein
MNFEDALKHLHNGKKIRCLAKHHEYIIRDGKIDYLDSEVKGRFEVNFGHDDIYGEWEVIDDDSNKFREFYTKYNILEKLDNESLALVLKLAKRFSTGKY